jgi:hypothetical protein
MVMAELEYHIAMATLPLRLQQPAAKPSIFPSDSDSQHSFTYLCRFWESSTLISLISVVKSEFSREFVSFKTAQFSHMATATPPPAFATTSTETIDFSIGFGFAALIYVSL